MSEEAIKKAVLCNEGSVNLWVALGRKCQKHEYTEWNGVVWCGD